MSPLTGWTFKRCESIASLKDTCAACAESSLVRTCCSRAGNSSPSFYGSAYSRRPHSASCPACPASSASQG
eukprot:1739836-Heterocapsa_arctica.AAC.1